MEYGVLGPLEVVRDGTPVHVGPLKQRALIILLLVRANRVVRWYRLIASSCRPAAGAGNDHPQSYVSACGGPSNPAGRPAWRRPAGVWRSPGYLLRVEPDELDTIRFERLVPEVALPLGAIPPGRWRSLPRRLGCGG